MKIGQYCQRQRCKHVELMQFWHAFASRGFVSDSWSFLWFFELTTFVVFERVKLPTELASVTTDQWPFLAFIFWRRKYSSSLNAVADVAMFSWLRRSGHTSVCWRRMLTYLPTLALTPWRRYDCWPINISFSSLKIGQYYALIDLSFVLYRSVTCTI